MRLDYFPDTESLYVDHASRKIDLTALTLSRLPSVVRAENM